MARRSYAGAAAALTLASGINATDLTITTTGTATGWPTGAGGKFLVVIARGTAAEEKAYVTSRSSNVLTVASTGDRGVDGTGAASHAAGVAVEHCIGAVDVDEANGHVATTTQDDHTQYLKTDGTRAFSAVTAIANSTPTTSAVGDAAAIGTGNVLARSTHVHGREAFAAPVATGTANAAGSATTVPHSDHVHLAYNHNAGRATKTGTQGMSTVLADITSLTVTFTAVASRMYKVTLWVPVILGTVTAAAIYLQEGATALAHWDGSNPDASSGFNDTAEVIYTGTFSAASHTLKATGIYISGGGGASLTVNGAATNPCLLLVEDIGS